MPLLWLVDAPTLVVALGVLGALAALLFAGGAAERRAALALALARRACSWSLSATHLALRLPGPFDTDRARRRASAGRRSAGVIAYPPGADGGDALVSYDQDVAPVPSHRRGAPLPDWRELGLGPQSIGYELAGPGRTLVIGGGGGRDVYNALSSGQRRVDVIELNREIRDMVDDELAPWSGRPFELPGVSVDDRRRALHARRARHALRPGPHRLHEHAHGGLGLRRTRCRRTTSTRSRRSTSTSTT